MVHPVQQKSHVECIRQFATHTNLPSLKFEMDWIFVLCCIVNCILIHYTSWRINQFDSLLCMECTDEFTQRISECKQAIFFTLQEMLPRSSFFYHSRIYSFAPRLAWIRCSTKFARDVNLLADRWNFAFPSRHFPLIQISESLSVWWIAFFRSVNLEMYKREFRRAATSW